MPYEAKVDSGHGEEAGDKRLIFTIRVPNPATEEGRRSVVKLRHQVAPPWSKMSAVGGFEEPDVQRTRLDGNLGDLSEVSNVITLLASTMVACKNGALNLLSGNSISRVELGTLD